MRGRHDHAKVERVPKRTTGADQIGGDEGFAMTGLKRMQVAQSDGDSESETDHAKAELLGRDKIGKGAAR